MPSSQPKLVLLDNTVLSNFAHVNRSDLVMALWSPCATTLEAWPEFQNGIAVGKLPKNAWRGLLLIELTESERELLSDLANVLGLGECTCIAVAKHRNGMFVTDDLGSLISE